MTPRRWLNVALGATIGILGALVFIRLTAVPPPERGAESQGPFLAQPYPAPWLALTDTRGDSVHLSDFRGRAAAVFFGYTHCPDVCPLTLARLSRSLQAMGEKADRLQVLFVTVDPARDSAAALARYLEAFDPSIVGLRGSEEALRGQATAWGVGFQRRDTGDDYVVDHTARVFLVDGEGRIVGLLSLSATADETEAALRRLVEMS